MSVQTYNLADLRRLEKRVSDPVDIERERYDAEGYRFLLDGGRATKFQLPRINRIRADWPDAAPTNLIYINVASGSAKATFTTEAVINDTAAMGPQPILGTYFWKPGPVGLGKTLRIVARGIFSDVATAPTWQWFCRLGGSESSTAGPNIGSTTALTSVVVTNALWEFEMDFVLRTMGAAGANSTGQGLGMLTSPLGLASPFGGSIFGGNATPGTISIDTSILNHINFDVACGTSSASNTITLLQLVVMGLN